MKAANGNVINILGHMANLLIADDVGEFMLGFDWLTAQKAPRDFTHAPSG